MLTANPTNRLNIEQSLEHMFFTQNPAGKMMDKNEYKAEMKARYKFVKQSIAAQKAARGGNGLTNRDVNLTGVDTKKLDELLSKSNIIPATTLCGNKVRLNIRDAKSFGEVIDQIVSLDASL